MNKHESCKINEFKYNKETKYTSSSRTTTHIDRQTEKKVNSSLAHPAK